MFLFGWSLKWYIGMFNLNVFLLIVIFNLCCLIVLIWDVYLLISVILYFVWNSLVLKLLFNVFDLVIVIFIL